MAEIKKVLVTADEDGSRLDRWFKRHFPEISFAIVARLARKGQIRLDSKRVEPSTRIITGQEVRFPLFEADSKSDKDINENYFVQKYEVFARNIGESLLYKDDHIIAINKPAGLAVQGGTKIKVSIDTLTQFWSFGYENKPKLVHRLDKETSGVLILARTVKAAQEISAAFKKHKIYKRYLTILQGVPKPLAGTIDAPLLKKIWEEHKEYVKISEDGKKAVTEYEVLDYAGSTVSLVEMSIITGRTHQVRAHSAAINCPVLGDYKYNKVKPNNLLYNSKFLHLHSAFVELELFGKKIAIAAPLPKHFLDTLEHFGLKENTCR